MVAPSEAPSRQPSIVLAVLLLVALTIGIAATFLSAPEQPIPPNVSSGTTPDLTVVVAEAVVGLVIALVVILAIARVLAGSHRGTGRNTATLLSVFVVAVVFLVLAHFVGSGGDLGGFTDQNGTPPSPPPHSGNGTLNLSNESNHYVLIDTTLPSWILYVGLAAAALIAVVVVVPLLQSRRAGGEAPPNAIEPARRSMEETLRSLESAAETDPRMAVIALYARLLQIVTPYLEHVDAATPREIERECVVRLHLHRENARALTGLFEEARYSTHPFSEAQVERAREALTDSLADLKTHREAR